MRFWLGTETALAFCLVFALPLRRPRWIRMTWLPILLAAFFLVSCGGNGSGGGSGGGGSSQLQVDPTPPGAYSVLVSGTANGIVHNAVVYVVVH